MELEKSGEICIGKDRHGGAQSLQVIEGLLPFTVPLNGSLFLPAFSPKVNSCRGQATCMNLGIN